jgi:Ni,Fe-hydrogenase I cytochrome b subunit
MRNLLVQINQTDIPTLTNSLVPSLYQAPSISVGHSDTAIMCIGLVRLLHDKAGSITTSVLVTWKWLQTRRKYILIVKLAAILDTVSL